MRIDDSAIWENIEMLLHESGMTKKELAERTGLSVYRFSRRKRSDSFKPEDDTRRISGTEMILIADALGVSLDTLAGKKSSIRSDADIARAILSISEVAPVEIEQHNSDCTVIIKNADALAHLYQLQKSMKQTEKQIASMSKDSKFAKHIKAAVKEMIKETLSDIEKDGRHFSTEPPADESTNQKDGSEWT